MHDRILKRSQVATIVGGIALGLAAGQVWGAGFQLNETSASGLGNAFAGGAAEAQDASTVWSNPAGMSRFTSPQVAVVVNLITPSFKLRNDGSQPAAFQPLGNSGGDAGSDNVVPNLYAVMPINHDWSFGLGINTPFGLVTQWGEGWIGRFQALKSDVKTINVNPSLSWRVNDALALGVGVDWQRIDATFTSDVNYSGALMQAAGQAAAGGLIPPSLLPTIASLVPGLSSHTQVKGNDSAWGWNIGILWDATPQTRIGAQYRSSIKYHVEGNVSFDNPALPAVPPPLAPVIGGLGDAVNSVLADGGVTADIKLPDIANVSVFHKLNDQWDLMADAQFTHWSVFKDLTFVRTTGSVLDSTPENFRDTWKLSAGASYHYSDRWTFRGGVAWDESPVNDTDRTPRLPDADRTWLTLGTQYRFNRNLALDAGVSYVWVEGSNTSQNAGSTAANGLIAGRYDGSATVVAAQLTYTF
ncbi:MAG: OmpP1/FadL family transporter [Casimicrobiaceae bacterium]